MLQENPYSVAMTYYIGANVTVGSGVAIAAGAVLAAAPGSRLIIESEVCIGLGVVVQAHGGDLIVRSGVSLGKGTLLLGTGSVGRQACIGAESTLINPQIQANQVVPARSLLGDPSQAQGNQPPLSPEVSYDSSHNGQTPNTNGAANNSSSESGDQLVPLDETSASTGPAATVYGREQVAQLVRVLFPHRDAVMSESDDL